jgi:acyl carrier protein
MGRSAYIPTITRDIWVKVLMIRIYKQVTSNAMTDIQLSNYSSEDIEDVLKLVEKSFNIKFASKELFHIVTFGELCDHISNKLTVENSDDCTTQQAFYKLRTSIVSVTNYSTITSDTLLEDIFPRGDRLLKIEKIEEDLGFNLSILRPPHFISIILISALLISLGALFFDWPTGLSGLLFSVVGLWIANKIGKELDLQTVGQLVKKIIRENYLKSRRNSNTFNKTEIERVLIDLFSDKLDLDKSQLTREAKIA